MIAANSPYENFKAFADHHPDADGTTAPDIVAHVESVVSLQKNLGVVAAAEQAKVRNQAYELARGMDPELPLFANAEDWGKRFMEAMLTLKLRVPNDEAARFLEERLPALRATPARVTAGTVRQACLASADTGSLADNRAVVETLGGYSPQLIEPTWNDVKLFLARQRPENYQVYADRLADAMAVAIRSHLGVL